MNETILVPASSFTNQKARVSWLVVAAAGCAIASTFCLSIDMAAARWFADSVLRGDFRKLVSYSEVFGHGFGVGLIIVTAAVLDVRGRRLAWYLAAHAYLAGIVADITKYLIGRCRPAHCENLLGSASETFVGLLPQWTFPPYHGWFDSRYASFPSAHAATAAGLALALGQAYPRGRWLFGLFALLAGLQRCQVHAHFPSDVALGYGIAFVVAACLARWTRIAELLDGPTESLPMPR